MNISVDYGVENAVDEAVAKMPAKPTQRARELLALALQAQIDERRGVWRARTNNDDIIRAGKIVIQMINADREILAEAALHNEIRFNTMLHSLVRNGVFLFPSHPND